VITLGVQFYEDRDSTYDEQLARETHSYRVVPREPDPDPRPPRDIHQILEEYINTPPGRVPLGHAFANPIRRGIDYVSTARRSMILMDPPYDYGIHRPLGNNILGGAVSHISAIQTPLDRGAIRTIEDEVTEMGRLIALGLQVPEELLSRPEIPPSTMADVPDWLRVGVWVKSKDTFA
jgi:hypothetical protein